MAVFGMRSFRDRVTTSGLPLMGVVALDVDREALA